MSFLSGAKRGVTQTEAFQRWFGNSVVRDSRGAPMVMHHSGSFDASENPIFDTSRGGIHFGTKQAAMDRIAGKFVDDAVQGAQVIKDGGRYYLDEYEYPEAPSSGFRTEGDARSYVAGEANRDIEYADLDVNITTAYLSIQNPKTVMDQGTKWLPAVSKAIKEGHDGIMYRNKVEDEGSISFIVFHPYQIKSATGNRGTFDPNDPNILHGYRRR